MNASKDLKPWGCLFYLGVYMQLHNAIFVDGRITANSTQIYLENITVDSDFFFVPVGDYQRLIGYLRFDRFCVKYPDSKADFNCFELGGLEPLDHQNPHPQLCLSGVLRSSAEFFLDYQKEIAFLQQEVARQPSKIVPSGLYQFLR